jgi:hypothetical protein
MFVPTVDAVTSAVRLLHVLSLPTADLQTVLSNGIQPAVFTEIQPSVVTIPKLTVASSPDLTQNSSVELNDSVHRETKSVLLDLSPRSRVQQSKLIDSTGSRQQDGVTVHLPESSVIQCSNASLLNLMDEFINVECVACHFDTAHCSEIVCDNDMTDRVTSSPKKSKSRFFNSNGYYSTDKMAAVQDSALVDVAADGPPLLFLNCNGKRRLSSPDVVKSTRMKKVSYSFQSDVEG